MIKNVVFLLNVFIVLL